MPLRVLAVDDDPISLAIATVLLESHGCLVSQAASGEAALMLLETAQPLPDVVLADLRMPALSGTALALRILDQSPAARLFAMSANPPLAVAGYLGVLRKPLTPESLSAVLLQPPSSDGSPGVAAVADDSGAIDGDIFERLHRAMSAPALEEVVGAFVRDTRRRIDSMRYAEREADLETIRRQAHTVRGGASMVGAVQVSVTAAIIEAGIDLSDERRRKLDELEAHLRRAEHLLKQRLQL